MFSVSIEQGAPVIRGANPFNSKMVWLPAAALCALAMPFGWTGLFAPVIWLALVAIENARGWKKALSFVIAGLLMLVVNSGVIPGNDHIALLAPYSDDVGNQIYASFRPAKAVIALTLVLFMLMRPQPLKRADLPVMAIAIAVPVIAGAFLLGVSVKLTATIALAALINLAVVCIAEEGFFRWVLQRGLETGLSQWKMWKWIVAVAVAALFTTLHTGWAASPALLALVGIAGLGYALVWTLRGSFWACVFTHWGVNLFHMTLLKYPF
ncbi:CPBP family intramembrane glutamic endopeptidase [Microbulbifer celer]|uniref:CPBP family intramembrane glutamic endopeptidase n=1 Tax=Microbulbifer celer TaxID=435905 RepID=A0ABW3U784_9GAMM|nr:CPBP family intramembrane glutamic endopeptidase [Microbulbifer celer]UFN56944.1 CPBP family intramembrane metalloprotease [Microbulbifer celer]